MDVFFVISGFLIIGHLWRGYQRTGTVGLPDFWGRRARRLLPAAVLVLVVTWLVSRLVLPASRLADTATQIRASALYFQNWQLAHDAVDYLTSRDPASPVQHFWSLSVEEQFYLLWPLLFLVAGFLARRRGGRSGRGGRVVVAGLTSVLVVGSLAYSVYETRVDPKAAYFVTTTQMWELGMGGLLALVPALSQRWLVRQGWLGWVGLTMVIASPFVLNGITAFPGAVALLPVMGAVLLIAGGSVVGRFGPAPLMSARPMVFLGGTSYALAWLTKIVVEDRVRLSALLAGHSWRSVSTALAVAVPVALVSVYIAGEPAQWDGKLGPGYPGAAVLARQVTNVKAEPVLPPLNDLRADVPGYWQQGCLDGGTSPPKECVYGDTTNSKLTVALVGDSVAGNWFPALQKIALQQHWKLVTEMRATCNWTATMTIDLTNGSPFTVCHQWGAAVLTQLEDHGISVVPIRETPVMGYTVPDCVAKYGASSAKCDVQVATVAGRRHGQENQMNIKPGFVRDGGPRAAHRNLAGAQES